MTDYRGLPTLGKNEGTRQTDVGISKAVYSPCGNAVYAGSADGRVFIWKAETGENIGYYKNSSISGHVLGISFHPKDHFIAFSTWGYHQPVTFYTWDEKSDATNCIVFNLGNEEAVASRISFDNINKPSLEEKLRRSLSELSISNNQHSELYSKKARKRMSVYRGAGEITQA
jgi:WD40 repeat protein